MLPAFGNGGITRGPSLAGETGKPEAVVPLPNGRDIPVSLHMPPIKTDIPQAPRAGGEVLVRIAAGPELYVAIDNRARNVVVQHAPAIVGAAVKTTEKNLPAMITKHQKRTG